MAAWTQSIKEQKRKVLEIQILIACIFKKLIENLKNCIDKVQATFLTWKIMLKVATQKMK